MSHRRSVPVEQTHVFGMVSDKHFLFSLRVSQVNIFLLKRVASSFQGFSIWLYFQKEYRLIFNSLWMQLGAWVNASNESHFQLSLSVFSNLSGRFSDLNSFSWICREACLILITLSLFFLYTCTRTLLHKLYLLLNYSSWFYAPSDYGGV